MLKRLELIGFKSFADRTAFDFAAGITAVVGPNGSGKSNVVDAVKWVLGEQSAKSLRGGEMADVIFNGSSTRKGLGLAEVTLTFDNARGVLATQVGEVRITRRVYRDGQGEYLINGQISRLRDIKELFLGTGAGAGAYSIIEQGRVDALLQAAQDDRRAIFEEAAGVSRFKARKAECLRRLERVGQNLDRLRDILGEVDGQLRGVRLQASKAQKHQEFATRLRELRVGLGLREFRALSDQLAGLEAQRAQITLELAASAAESEQWTVELRRADEAVAAAASRIRACDFDIADAAARIAALQVAWDRDRDLARQFEDELARDRAGRLEASRRLCDLVQAGFLLDQELETAEATCAAGEAEVESIRDQMRLSTKAAAEARDRMDEARTEHLARLRSAARWQNEAVSAKAMLDQLHRERDRLAVKGARAKDHIATADAELLALVAAEREQVERWQGTKADLEARQAQRDALQARGDELQRSLADARADAATLAGRIEVMDNLERTRDGLNEGLRLVFDRLAADPAWSNAVPGWVADCLIVDREHAWLIDLALGSRAESFVVRTSAGVCQLLNVVDPLPGRVEFVPLDEVATHWPQVLAPNAVRADELVQPSRPEFADLPRRLLGSTLIVRDIVTAQLWRLRLPGMRFVTRQGEVLEADGTLTVGQRHTEAGWLSRRSELRELRAQYTAAKTQLTQQETAIAQTAQAIAAQTAQLMAIGQEMNVQAEQLTDLRARLHRHRERLLGLQEEIALTHSEVGGLDAEIRRHDRQWSEAKYAAEEEEQLAQEARTRFEFEEWNVRRHEEDCASCQLGLTEAEVALGRARERHAAAADRRRRHDDDVAGRQDELAALDRRLRELNERLIHCQLAQLTTSADLADAHRTRELAERDRVTWSRAHEEARAALRLQQAAIQAAQGASQQQRDQCHALQLAAGEVRHRCDALAGRLAEDYQVDLRALYAEDAGNGDQLADLGGLTAEAAQVEIDDLRKKLQRLGSVNLDALEELKQVEAKAGHLHVQLDDLNHARKALEDIINKINGDSQRLFVDTFAAIREHFQDLFRRLFGGGMADIVLAQPDDPLESDIDIVARPPGKELRSISLMSGGERTLTAVALLLAIFRSKPSPFCLLDEVDAALDEANTARLAGVLREFASNSQFIVVTHAKRTMAAADVLYGVTMQESGISKRIAVRFEDWPSEERRIAA